MLFQGLHVHTHFVRKHPKMRHKQKGNTNHHRAKNKYLHLIVLEYLFNTHTIYVNMSLSCPAYILPGSRALNHIDDDKVTNDAAVNDMRVGVKNY